MSEIEPRHGGNVEASRGDAAASVHSGLSLTVAGVAAIGAAVAGIVGPVTAEVALVGTLVTGIGLFKIGGAAGHLLRFGRRLPTAAVLSAAGLGAAVASWPLLAALEGFGVLDVPMWIRQLLGASVMGLLWATVLLTLAAVLFRDRDDPEDAHAPVP